MKGQGTVEYGAVLIFIMLVITGLALLSKYLLG